MACVVYARWLPKHIRVLGRPNPQDRTRCDQRMEQGNGGEKVKRSWILESMTSDPKTEVCLVGGGKINALYMWVGEADDGRCCGCMSEPDLREFRDAITRLLRA